MAKKPQRAHRDAKPALRHTKKNLLTNLGLNALDYKDTAAPRVFISERGKIRSHHVTGLTDQEQRQVATAIKNAREMALLPYPGPSTNQGTAR